MNRIYLNKLLDFTKITYYNSYSNTKLINLQDEITKVKQNISLNESGSLLKYNFVDLNNLINGIDVEYNPMVLIYPVCFNLSDYIEWYNLLNCLLLVMNDDYLKETNIGKKKILQIADKMYRKKIVVDKDLTTCEYNKISELSGIGLIVIEQTNEQLKFSEYLKTDLDKWIICLKYNNEYFPIWNFEKKFFSVGDNFVKYLRSKCTTNMSDNEKNSFQLEELETETIYDENKSNKINEAYEEFETNENYALYISEAVDVKTVKKQDKKNKKIKLETEEKKTKKTNKNIFVTLENNIPELPIDPNNKVEDSVFKHTEKITKSMINTIIKNIKSNTKLEQIQTYAIELGICIASGSTKDGKPKNKTRNELIEEIKNMEKNVKT